MGISFGVETETLYAQVETISSADIPRLRGSHLQCFAIFLRHSK
jgi:hypothetical protein